MSLGVLSEENSGDRQFSCLHSKLLFQLNTHSSKLLR
jgi:hypothetical protein